MIKKENAQQFDKAITYNEGDWTKTEEGALFVLYKGQWITEQKANDLVVAAKAKEAKREEKKASQKSLFEQMEGQSDFKANSMFTEFLNSDPVPEYIKKEKTGATSIPVEYLREMADKDFGGQWSSKPFSFEQIFKETDGGVRHNIVVIVELTFTFPITGFVKTLTGIGNADAGATKYMRLQADAVALAFAEKSALAKLGRRYGRGLSKDFDGEVKGLEESVTEATVKRANNG